MKTLWKVHAVRVGISGFCPVSPKARGACCGVTRRKKAFELMVYAYELLNLYGSPSYRHHHPRASPPHHMLPQLAPFPSHFPPSPRTAQPRRPSPPGSRRGPGPSSPAAMGAATDRAGRGERIDWPRVSRGRSSALSANRQRQRGGASRFNGWGDRKSVV